MESTLWFCVIKSFMKVVQITKRFKWTEENDLRLCGFKVFFKYS